MKRRSMTFAAVRPLAAIALAAALGGCVATQKVPVSTDPSGAVVYLDGKQACAATPCSVEIPKDQDHLLTIIKDGYRQKDIPVRRVFDTAAVLRESVRDGVRSGGVEGALSSADKQERDGRAYKLSPEMVTLKLIGVNEPEPAPAREQGTGDPVVDMGIQLFQMLEGGKGGAGQ